MINEDGRGKNGRPGRERDVLRVAVGSEQATVCPGVSSRAC